MKKEMELQEVSNEELEKLGENKIKEKFNSGFFIIKLSNGSLIDCKSVTKYSIENNIKEPFIFINPNFKYVKWVVKKDFTTPQIKKQIRKQLANNTDTNLVEIQKALLIEDVKSKKHESYINEVPIKTSNYISEGKFLIQSSCSRENAIKMMNEVIEELKTEEKKYVENKFKKDYKNISFYLIFIFIVCFFWYINKEYKTLPIWISNSLGLFLFLISLVVMRLINHSIFDIIFFNKKAEKKYVKEFYNKLT
ncbi:hypothetical protein AAGV28_10910 [Flavobacterium sp. FZUC8N2.13]|uniref:Uncharacterized protein n=1 Tax=Flavobacterium zubiriense TaxID=3138075 RepID=A0ABV4TCQ1_9FLAO